MLLATSCIRSTDRTFKSVIRFHRQEKFRNRITRISCLLDFATLCLWCRYSRSETLNCTRPVFKLQLDLGLNSAKVSTTLKKYCFRFSVIWRRVVLKIIVNILIERAAFLFTVVWDAASRCFETSVYIYLSNYVVPEDAGGIPLSMWTLQARRS